MLEFIASSAEQLGKCLRYLYSEGISEANVSLSMTPKGKVTYTVTVDADEEKEGKMNERFKIMIS